MPEYRRDDDASAVKLAVITCAVLESEVDHFRQKMDHIVHVEILKQGLHNEPNELRRQAQAAITQIEKDFEQVQAIVLGYGLCSRGTEGLATSRCQLVMARAHDCITLLLGCKDRYAQYVKENPGTYWYSPGWNRHHIPPGQERYEKLYREYVAKYGEDNADFLMETEQHWFQSYDRATYVDLGVAVTTEDLQYTRTCADWLKWSFDRQKGDPTLLRDLLAGCWDEQRFLVVPPGHAVCFSGDEQVVKAERLRGKDEGPEQA